MSHDQKSSGYVSDAKDVDRLLAVILSSGIVRFAELRAACADFDTDRTDQSAVHDLCELLIDNGTITTWQSEKLLAGKWKGFYIDHYCMRAQIGKGETTSTYLAKDSRTGELVALVVSPPMIEPWVNGRPVYSARELTPQERRSHER